MRPRIIKCIKCSAPLSYFEIRAAGPFSCPVCDTKLQASKVYTQLSFYGTVLFVLLVFVALGFRGIGLLVATIFGSVPAILLVANYLKYFIPPKIVLYVPKLPEDASLNLRDGPNP